VSPVGIDPDQYSTVFQPIIDMDTDEVVGYEALTRFKDGRATDAHLATADSVPAAEEMERDMVTAALEAGYRLPESGAWIAVKVSSGALLGDPSIGQRVSCHDRPIWVEIPVPSSAGAAARVRQARQELSSQTVIALEHVDVSDEALSTIIDLRPHVIKLDVAVAAGLADDRDRQARLSDMLDVAAEGGYVVVASGIEAAADRSVLAELGVYLGQGYLLGRPADVIDL